MLDHTMLHHRVMTALVTPFTKEDTIDFPALQAIIDSVIAQGSDGLVMLGTTAESPTITLDERWMLYHFIMQHVNRRVPVYAGVGTNHTKETLQYTKMAEEAKADGIMVVVPYYNRPQQEGLYQHFKTIANATTLPMMMYSVPSRCGVRMEAETVIRLANDCPNILAYKYANSDLSDIKRLLSSAKSNFVIYSGEDGMLLEGLREGMQGVVSVISHIHGAELKQLIDAFHQGSELLELDAWIKQQATALFCESSPVPIKFALHELGLCEATVRLPLVPLREENQQLVRSFLQHS